MTSLRIGTLFPATFNLNGDVANASILARRLTLSGHDTRVVPLDVDAIGEGVAIDALIIGSPSSSGMRAPDVANPRVIQFLTDVLSASLPVLAVSNGFHLMGSLVDKDDTEIPSWGLLPVATRLGESQHVTIGAQIQVPNGVLVGVENHNATTTLEKTEWAWGTVQFGVGNNAGGGDGFRQDSVWATHLHGPLFAMNPVVADEFAQAVLARRGEDFVRGTQLDELDSLARAASEHLIRKRSS